MDFELKVRPVQQPLIEPSDISHSSPERRNSRHQKEINPNNENNLFKPLIFLEFFVYFMIKAFLGPLSYYFFKRFIPNGEVLAKNLQVFEGKGAVFGSFSWIMKIYCIVSTFVFKMESIQEKISQQTSGYEYDSTSQFSLLLHTEISLSVLYGAYYSSLTDSEILRMRTEIHDSGVSIFERVLNLIRLGKAKLYEVTNVAKSFPEIDLDSFYFVYPKEAADVIPQKLCPEPIDKYKQQLSYSGIKDGLIVHCDRYATHIAEIGGYQQFDLRVKVIKYLSRGLVFINAILPVINNIYQILYDDYTLAHFIAFTFYLTQQIGYSYLIYRLAIVYDILFLGLMLYYKKYQMLSLMCEVVKLKPEIIDETQKPLYIPVTTQQNVENWLSVRKVLASINGQAFVVIDTNMSFVLLYTLLFIGFYVFSSLNVMKEVFLPFQQFLSDNKAVQTVLTLTVVVVTIVLIIDIALGILINRLFMYEKHEWVLQETMVTNIKADHLVFRDLASGQNLMTSKSAAYAQRMKEIGSMMGDNMENYLYPVMKKLRESIILVIKAIEHEEFFNPHTLLGIRTDVRLVVALGTAISAIGVSTIVRIAQNVVSV